MQHTRPRARRRRPVPGTVVAVLLAAGLVVAGLLSAGWGGGRPGPPGGPGTGDAAAPALIGEPAPPLAGRTLSGGTLDLADLRGSVVVISVWAAWCAPCREELPLLIAAQREHPDLRWVGIDTRDGERQARELLAAVGGDPATSLVDPDGVLAAAWHVAGVPETVVVDAAGVVRARRLGPVGADWLDDAVTALLPAG